MSYTSITFICFLLVTGIAYFLVPRRVQWGVLLAAFCLLFVISLLQERGVAIRQNLARQVLPVRWSVYFGLLFAFIIFGAYGGDFTNTAFIYGEF